MHRGEKKFFKDINATDDGISLKENGGEDNLPFPFEDNHSFHFYPAFMVPDSDYRKKFVPETRLSNSNVRCELGGPCIRNALYFSLIECFRY